MLVGLALLVDFEISTVLGDICIAKASIRALGFIEPTSYRGTAGSASVGMLSRSRSKRESGRSEGGRDKS